MVAKPLRMALGSLMIQKKFDLSDRDMVEQLQENPYYQYFIGLPGYQMETPFVPSLLLEFRKRLTDEVVGEINEIIRKSNTDDEPLNGGGSDECPDEDEPANEGTLILDATCAPQNIKYPQDVNLLNETREKLEGIIDRICHKNGLCKPRMYRRNARRDYLKLARCKKRTKKKIRKAIKQQLQYIKRDRGYIDRLAEYGKHLNEEQRKLLAILDKVYEQQKYMYDNDTHTVKDRIVSISQPHVAQS